MFWDIYIYTHLIIFFLWFCTPYWIKLKAVNKDNVENKKKKKKRSMNPWKFKRISYAVVKIVLARLDPDSNEGLHCQTFGFLVWNSETFLSARLLFFNCL